MARLLSPNDFGLFGITLVVLSILDRFTNTGFQAALVQRDRPIDDYLDTAWTVHALRGTTLSLALILSAPYLAAFFNEVAAAPLIRMLGVAVLMEALVNPGILHYRRELDVRPQFIQRLSGTGVDLTISIVLAFLLRNAWALMFGMIAGRATRLILSYTLHTYRPRPRIDLTKVRELRMYGQWIFLNNVLFFLAYRGDNFVIGKFLGAPALGIYMMAYSIAEILTVEISQIVGEVGFPAYSRMQDDSRRLTRAFVATFALIAAISFPVVIGIWLLAEPMTQVVLGASWGEVATLLPFLAVAGAVRAMVVNGAAAFNALGRPELSFRMNLVCVFVTYAAMVVLTQPFGLVGVALAVTLGQVFKLAPFAVYLRRVAKIDVAALTRSLIPACVLSVAVWAVVGGLLTFLPPMPDMLRLMTGCGGWILTYGAVSLILWMAFSAGPLHTAFQIWHHRQRSRSISSQGVGVLATSKGG